jgi:hypothetical protein
MLICGMVAYFIPRLTPTMQARRYLASKNGVVAHHFHGSPAQSCQSSLRVLHGALIISFKPPQGLRMPPFTQRQMVGCSFLKDVTSSCFPLGCTTVEGLLCAPIVGGVVFTAPSSDMTLEPSCSSTNLQASITRRVRDTTRPTTECYDLGKAEGVLPCAPVVRIVGGLGLCALASFKFIF